MKTVYIVMVDEETYYNQVKDVFLSKEKAKEYANKLEDEFYKKPPFLTDELEELINVAGENSCDYPELSYDESRIKYLKDHHNLDITNEMIHEYDDWQCNEDKYFTAYVIEKEVIE